MKTDSLFALLRLGLEVERPSEEAATMLCELSLKDWRALRGMADKQGVSAIVFDGLQALVAAYGKEKVAPRINPSDWQMFVYDWIGVMTQVEYGNMQQRTVMEDMAAKWGARGCRVMVFKGQASGTMYPQPQHRSPGDIDCYLFEDYARGNDIAREAGAKVDEGWYKHSQIHYKGEMFENHQYFVHTRDGKRGKRLEKELEEALEVDKTQFLPLTSNTILPPTQWTAMFLTYHACAHFISEGLRLKQVLDWAMFLDKHQDEVDWPRFYAFCERYHLRRFADAATTIGVEHLGVKVTSPQLVSTSPYAEKILQSALYDDNYVFGSGEGSWHNRWHLVRNLFHYRWKYEDIYEMSPWKQLWFYTSGYLFHTE